MNELLTMLDSKYKRLEYIQSTGTQYIDTGILGKGSLTFNFKYSSIVTAGGLGVFGSRQEYGIKDLDYLHFYNNGGRFDYFGSHIDISSLGYNVINIIKTRIEDNSYIIEHYNVNNVLIETQTTTVSNNSSSLTLKLFGLDTNGTFQGNTNCKIYYFQIYDNGTLVRNFIPVLRKSDNEIGMLDLVEGKFYGNAGTGKFTANLDTMYALIQGTPTVQDGRVSGFSTSNYLKISGLYDFSQPFEIKTKIHLNSNPASSSFIRISGNTSGYAVVLVGQSGTVGVYMNDNDDTTLSNGNIAPANTIPTNTDIFLKFVFTGTEYAIYVSTNEKEYTKYLVVTSSKVIGNDKNILLGANPPNQSFAVGSINLNRSYIKIDDTKYKLQAVVGYSKVGTLTENPTGVFSGFSGSNYLKTALNYTIDNMNDSNYEFLIKFTPNASMSYECYALKYYNGSTVRGLGIHNNKFAWTIGYPNTSGHTGSIVSTFDVSIGTTYWLKGIYQNKIARLYYSLDGNNYTLIGSVDETNQTFKITKGFYFGATENSSYGVFDGSIDMNETYIKINNKLWFNGLEA